MASLVIMNYSRPQMVSQLAQNYATYSCLDQVLVVDCQPGRLALAASDRLTMFTMDPDPGLYAPICSGRTSPQQPGYRYRRRSHGSARIIGCDDCRMAKRAGCRTWCVRAEGRCRATVRHAGDSTAFPRQHSIDSLSGCQPRSLRPGVGVRGANCPRVAGLPKGNGEDIVLSLTAMAEARKPNRIHAIPVHELLPDDDPDAISVRWPGHAEHRTAVVRWCLTHIVKR